jgi:hypothetical protein
VKEIWKMSIRKRGYSEKVKYEKYSSYLIYFRGSVRSEVSDVCREKKVIGTKEL